MHVEIDREKWSRSSQRSAGGHYDPKAQFYEGISCRCQKCECSFVFTAEEQKETYEVRKEFVWKLPSLCSSCQNIWQALNTELKHIQLQWNEQKAILSTNREFLENWRHLLKEIQTYSRKGSSPSNIKMINKLLNQLG